MIIQQCLEKEVFSDEMKLADVSFIFKNEKVKIRKTIDL